jgi:hypothetical protein
MNERKVSRMENPFKNWTTTPYCVISPDAKYCLWIANGFLSFKDYNHHQGERFLFGMNIYQRWRVWRLLKQEINSRAFEYLECN